MKRPWQVWLALAACGALVACAMAWLTLHALRADRELNAERAAADLERRVSLALWRMDTKLAPLIAEESARPHFYYTPFITVEAPRSKAGPAVEQVASPLLLGNSGVLLNFNATPTGDWSSPQAPGADLTTLACANGMTLDEIGGNRARLAELAANVSVADLLAQLPVQPLPKTNESLARGANGFGGGFRIESNAQQAAAPPQDAARGQFFDNYAFTAANQAAAPLDSESAQAPASSQENSAPPNAAGAQSPNGAAAANQQQSAANPSRFGQALDDLGDRSSRYQSQVEQEYVKQRRENSYQTAATEEAVNPVVENVSRPLWVGDRLLLARRVVLKGSTMVQGSWLDWPHIKEELLAETADLLPDADLTPVRLGESPDPTRMLAGLPVRLVATESPLAATAASPLQWSLGVGWAAIVLALAAVAGLLWGVMALSERRAAFVSSVTHELRTPLTTFRMYSELLARDMAPSAERRREYLETLRTEAERLTHLVDNVLAYARLERGRRPRRIEQTTPGALIERFEPRLSERAAQAGMSVECDVAGDAASAALRTDVGVVEQILFNLVDNAAKYAGRAADRRIHLDVTRRDAHIEFTVRDHGPGFISLRAAAHSAPFSKSAEEAAETAPGVGLGLALCRRLARELGGRLDAAAAGGEGTGAAVSLRLPLGD